MFNVKIHNCLLFYFLIFCDIFNYGAYRLFVFIMENDNIVHFRNIIL